VPLPRRLPNKRSKAPPAICCATVSAGVAPGPLQGLIEIHPVDRETARKNIGAGLLAGGFAAAVFALCFVAAFLYIAQ
jgi:hypothetical protein